MPPRFLESRAHPASAGAAMATFAPSYSPPLVPTPPASASEEQRAQVWHPATRIAFRFCCVYFSLYIITTQMLPGLTLILPDFGTRAPMKQLTLWVGHHILGLATISTQVSGSGDKLFNWTHAFTLLLVATVSTIVWTAVARDRVSHQRAFAWFRLFLRLAVATTFFSYGFAKAFPTQMPVLALQRLVEPFGNFSPMGVLWYSIGAAPAYEIATGCAEVLAGVLLFVPRLTVLGAMVALMDATMIFLLNMTYDVPVKLFSFHLLLMALVLLAPNARRLFDLLVLHRTSEIRVEPAVVRSSRGQRGVVIAQIVVGALMFVLHVYQGNEAYHSFGGGAPKSPLYGIWNVTSMSVDGADRPALLGDTRRLKRIIFQTPAGAFFQTMDDSLRRVGAKLDTTAGLLTLTSGADTAARMALTYRRPDHEHLLIDGLIDGRPTHLALEFKDPDSFLQRSRGFNWVQEVPFNR
jgi:hypothetical protein